MTITAHAIDQSTFNALINAFERQAKVDGTHATKIPALGLIRVSELNLPITHSLFKPCACIILQGRKDVFLSENCFTYAQGDYLVSSVHLPVKGLVVEASKNNPYMCIQIELNSDVMYEVMKSAELPLSSDEKTTRGLFVEKIDLALLESVTRLINLLDSPKDIAGLSGLFLREVYYRLLTGTQGQVVRAVALTGSKMQRISQVLQLMNKEFDKPLQIADFCKIAGMSTASFHQHFKAMTSMTPIQYQKQLRLIEARKIC
ncbi:MAG: AraC family transcriptional regulator [Gammaproteobacteria bacterium]|nr:MAG: AraC family transcriptional regulator [Gammaproteobacteria bacterium]